MLSSSCHYPWLLAPAAARWFSERSRLGRLRRPSLLLSESSGELPAAADLLLSASSGELLSRIEIKAQQQLAPRVLEPDQRLVLRNLVEKADDLRGEAIFALGYWAGYRVSDLAHLLMEHAHVGPKIGWVQVGHKGEKFRDKEKLKLLKG